MVTNNCVNLKNNGIVSYDGAGVFSALANPLTVSNGGQGNSSLTTYAVLCGGTTSTNPIQSIASVGTSGQKLVSNGAGALPTMQTASSAPMAVFTIITPVTSTLTDATTYYIYNKCTLGTVIDIFRIYIPVTGTINICYGTVTFTAGSSESCTIRIRHNNTTNYDVTTSLDMSSSPKSFSSTNLGISVTANDYIYVQFITPTWSADPASAFFSITIAVS